MFWLRTQLRPINSRLILNIWEPLHTHPVLNLKKLDSLEWTLELNLSSWRPTQCLTSLVLQIIDHQLASRTSSYYQTRDTEIFDQTRKRGSFLHKVRLLREPSTSTIIQMLPSKARVASSAVPQQKLSKRASIKATLAFLCAILLLMADCQPGKWLNQRRQPLRRRWIGST